MDFKPYENLVHIEPPKYRGELDISTGILTIYRDDKNGSANFFDSVGERIAKGEITVEYIERGVVMTAKEIEIIEQLENAIELIKQDGKDWLDDRDIPILEACIKSLTALDKIRDEFISLYPKNYAGELELGGVSCVFSLNKVLNIIDKYKASPTGKEVEE